MQFLVKTPNPNYARKVLGIQFSKGSAFLTDVLIDGKIGESQINQTPQAFDVLEIAKRMHMDFGYSVEPQDDAARAAMKEIEAAPKAEAHLVPEAAKKTKGREGKYRSK